MNNQSKDKLFKIAVIILGILVVIGLFGNIYLLLKKQNPSTSPISQITPVPTQGIATPTLEALIVPTLIPGITANWKTYTDTIYKFQIKVPATWFLYPTYGSKDGKIYPGDTFEASTYDRDNKNNYNAKGNLLGAVKNPLAVQISVSSDNKESLEEIKTRLLSQIGDVGYNPDKVISEVNGIILDSRRAIKVLYNPPDSYYIVVLDDKDYKFDMVIGGRDLKESNEQLFDQILSTFKFLD